MRTRLASVPMQFAALTLILVPYIAAGSTASKDSTAAQGAKPAAAPTMSMKEAKQKLGIIVYPAKGQPPQQQEADELACLEWGAEQIGIKTNAPPPDANAAGQQAKAKADSATQGAAVKGAAKGAAVGAIIGSISGNAGAGAAYGAAGGALVGRKARKQVSAQAEAEAKKKVEAEQKAKIDGLKKAMTACLEPKGYTVK